MTGRPPKINTVVLVRPAQGDQPEQRVTAGQRIVEALRIGNYVETAAALAGVDKTTVYEWLKVGATATDLVHRQGKRMKDLTQHQRDCMAFSHAVAEAEAASEVEDVAELAALGRGGRQVTTTTTKRDADGKVIEHVTKVETTQPNAQVLEWRLERRHPDKYGRRRLEISGPDGEAIPVDVRVAALVAAARQHHEGVIDVESEEVGPDQRDLEEGDDDAD